MKKKFNQLLESKKLTGYLILVLFSAVALITALIFGSDTRKNEILTNSLERMATDLGCPDDADCGDENSPSHTKNRINKGDGTYELSLTVTGKSQPDVRPDKKANVIIVMDTSGSMQDPADKSSSNTRQSTSGNTVGRFVYDDDISGHNGNYYWRLYYQYNGNYYPEGTGPQATTRHSSVVYPSNINQNGNVTWVNPGNVPRYNFRNNNDSRMDQTTTAVKNAIDSLLSQNTIADDMVEISLIKFSTYSNYVSPSSVTVENWTKGTDGATLKNQVDTGLIPVGSTNWDLALYNAQQLARVKKQQQPAEDVYIIFFSDGEPTVYNGSVSSATSHSHNSTTHDDSGGRSDAEDRNSAYYEANQIRTAGYNLFGIFAYGDGNGETYMKTLTSYGKYGNANHTNEVEKDVYFSAGNEEELNNAFSSIVSTIIASVGHTDVSIHDGTTNNVSTSSGKVSHLLEVDTTSFKYYKGGEPWPDAPKATFNANTGAVDWDLSSIGVLENDVEYKVTFDVYPSQETYDLVTNFKNGTISYNVEYTKAEYNALPENLKMYYQEYKDKNDNFLYYGLDKNIKYYLSENYQLKTNTNATLTYSDTRPDSAVSNKTISYNDLDGEPIVSSEIEVEKVWINKLDKQSFEDYVLDLHLIRDGVTTADNSINVSKDTDWKGTKYISTGLIRKNADNTLQVLDSGHDYTIEEPEDISYHWELQIEVVHPMLINSNEQITTLIEVKENDIPASLAPSTVNNIYFKDSDNKEYYKFNNKVYLVKSVGSKAEVKAYNNRKSVLDLTKKVTGDAPKGKKFKFTAKVTDQYADEGQIWFSVNDYTDPKNRVKIIDLETDATAETDANGKTGYYHIASGKEFYVYLQDNWTLRFINLSSGTEYTISEPDIALQNETQALDKSIPQYFYLEGIESTTSTLPDGVEYNPTITKPSITGTIVAPDVEYDITYKNKYPGTYLTVKKEWIGSSTNSVDVQLYQKIGNGEVTPVEGKIGTLNANNNWTYTFEGLALVDESTTPVTPITYSVQEVEIKGYKSELIHDPTVDNHLWTLINTELTDIEVTKNWNDANNQDGLRNADTKVKFELYADGEATGKTVELSGNPTANTSKNTFTGLEKYKLVEGELVEIEYTVKEVEAPNGYTATAVCPSTTEAEATAIVTTECTGANAIGTKDNDYTITNKHIPEVIDVTVNKLWADGFNQDAKRPDSVEVTLYQKIGEGETTAVTDKDGNIVKATLEYVEKDGKEDPELSWKHIFEDLPKYSNGQEITYSAVETKDNDVLTGTDGPGTYAIDNGGTVKGADGAITVTNTHTPETVNVQATKVWDDANNQDGIRPRTITFTLNNDKNVTISNNSIELDGTPDEYEEGTDPSRETAAWVVTFKNLPKYSKGEEIVYSVTEETNSVIKGTEQTDDAAGTYKFEVTGSMANGFTIKNIHTPETVDIPVEKVWIDREDESNRIPINVQLYQKIGNADKVAVSGKTTTLSKENAWKDTFTGLPKYSNASQVTEKQTEIVYSVEETTTVPGYNAPEYATVDGTLQIKNTLSKTKVTVVKQWNDNNNKYENRPENLTIALNYGEKTCTLNEENWTCTFDNLPTHVNGKAFTYDADETSVPTGYVKGEKQTSTDADGNKTITINNNLETKSLSGNKTWSDSNQEGNQPDSVTIKLKEGNNYVKNADGSDVTTEATKDNNWKYEFTGLPKYVGKQQAEYSVEEVTPNGYVASYNGNDIINTLDRVKITGKKVWKDEYQYGNQTSITVNLKRNGVQVSNRTVSANSNWEFTFDNLPTHVNGEEVAYTIEEIVPAGYEGKVSRPEETVIDGVKTYNYTIENTLTTTEFNGEKIWSDGFDKSNRPDSIIVNLMTVDSTGNKTPAKDAEGEAITQEVKVDNEGKWKYSFKKLPTHVNGKEVTYAVEEVVPTGYTASYSGNNITNKLVTTKLTVNKVWADENQYGNQTAITVKLLANGNVVKDSTGAEVTGELTSSNGWTYEFTNLPVYSNNEEVTYSVEEVALDAYDTKIEKDTKASTKDNIVFTVTNTLKKTEATIIKVWDDNDNQDDIRPTSLKVTLSNGQEVTLSADKVDKDGNWTATVKDLPVYVDGKEFNYTWEEKSVPTGYTVTSNSTNGTITTIKNTHGPETIKIVGTKYWDDTFNQDGLRKDDTKITVTLTDNIGSDPIVKEVSKGTNSDWAFEFDNLPKYNHSKTAIVYTVTETQVDGYEKPIVTKVSEQDNVITYLITNKHTPITTKVEIKKTWDDNNDQDGVRKDVKATVQLYANGKPVNGKNAEVGKDNNWSVVFDNLPVNSAGTPITYSVEETFEEAEGYTRTDNKATLVAKDKDSGTITVINTRPTEETRVDGTKTWADNNDQDGIRPTSITVKLKADGQYVKDENGNAVFREVTEDENGDWKYSFTELPRYKNGGTEIKYSVEEVQNGKINGNKETGYETSYSNYNITNTHTPEKTSITFNKAWDDNSNQDGLRYKSNYEITLIGTTEDGSVDLSEHNPVVTINPNVIKDTYTWTNLPKYDNGKEITYTVKESKVSDGYTATAKGYEDKEEVFGDAANKYTIKNYHKPEETEITVTKEWDDGDDQDGIRPDDIELTLYANGDKYDAEQPEPVKKDNKWTYTYTGLPKKADGTDITWTVTEKAVDGYTGTPDGLYIKNYHKPEEIEIPITKQWVDNKNQDGKRPSEIEVILLADGSEYDKLTLKGDLKATSWSDKFTGLPKYKDGEEIKYTIQEVQGDFITGDVTTGYTSTINPDNKFEIINTHSPAEKVVEGKKIWVDGDNQDDIRPTSIRINLLKNGKVIDTKTITAEDADEDGNWTYKWEKLPEFEDGNKINYQIDEESVPEGYSKTVSTYDITNTHTPATVNVVGTKHWNDADDQDGIRPETITVKLAVDGKVVKDKDGKEMTKTISEATNWKFSFDELPKYNHSKDPIKYSVIEIHEGVVNGNKETGYDPEIKDITQTGDIEFKITNNHTPETVTYEITKVWDDEDDNDAIRPTSIKVKLLADGKVIETVTVKPDKNGDWKYSFGPLDKNKAGKEIKYTIEEEDVAGYTPSTSEPKVVNKTITQVLTNKHTPEKTSINGTKTWIDENDKAGKRPKNITVYVYADGKKIAELTVSADTNWEYEIKDLYKFNHSTTPITYTIEELPVEDYETEYEGFNITNIITEVAGEEEELPPDTFAKDQSTYRLDLLLMLIGGMILSNYKRVIKE